MKTKLLLTALFTFIFCLLSSQIPQGFNYQAIARDGAGNPISNATIKVKLSILSDTTGFFASGSGIYLWEEEQTNVKTNAFGLFTIVFGNPLASKVQGSAASFSAIDWAKAPLYIGTKIANPTSYKNMGSAKLWSVPYSMVTDSTKALLKGSKLSVVSSNDLATEALFEVKRKDGQTVFAVYPDAVNIYVPRTAKGAKGGFAIGGFDQVKTGPQDYFRVTPDSVRIYIDKTPTIVKGATKGGFAIGGFDQAKGGVQDLLTVSNDSIRMYINDVPGKGATKGGFAIGGFDQAKGNNNFLNIATKETGIIDPPVNRIVWYPLKNAFLTGNVFVASPSDVGLNSFASGFRSKAKGQYSQALGFQAVALGDYSTAIGKNAAANNNNSFAFGDNATSSNEGSFAFGTGAVASGSGSYALGINCLASGLNSFAFGDNSQAIGSWTYAIGYHNTATWGPSYAFGDGTTSKAWGATTFGWSTLGLAEHSTTLGRFTIGNSYASLILGSANDTTTMHPGTAYGYSRNYWWSDDPAFIIGNGDMSFNGSAWVVNSRKNAFIVLKSGATGINMNYPSYMLDVNGEITSRNNEAFRVRNASYSSIIHQDASDLYLMVTNSGNPDGSWNSLRPFRMNYNTGNVYMGSNNNGADFSLTVQSDGKVGIGTQTPDQNLTLNGNMKFTGGYIAIMNGYNKNIIQSGWTGGWYNYSMLSSSWDWSGTKSPGSIVTSEQFPLVVTSGNNGTPNASTHLSVDNNGDIFIPNIQTTTSGSGSGVTFLQWTAGGKLVKYSISSSRRYKENISNLENVDWLYNLNPVNYSFINDKKHHMEYGLIAEEVEKINPVLVVYNEKNEVESVSYNSLIAPLIKAAQDQKNKIETLTIENQSLKDELHSLKEKVEKIEALLAKSGVK